MPKLQDTLGRFRAHRQHWERLMRDRSAAAADHVHSSHHLEEVREFGSNPGDLRMFTHLPPQGAAGCGLVVVLHGCGQTAAGYDVGAGWSTLANRYGFALLLPEQQHSNNANLCFNWFQPGDMERGHGEALSIRQMVGRMVTDHGIDPRRVFITGLSAGGAMTCVMLATYPEVFAGGAIVGGLPYGAACNMLEAFETMFRCPPRPAAAWGDLVRAASPHDGPWPCVSVWHGGADTTVIPSNAREIVKQWTHVHGLPGTPTFTETVDGYPRQVWSNAAGEAVLESYTIPTMAHGTPLHVGDGDHQCGAAGAFLLDVGISSSYHIAKFWGLAVRPGAAVAAGRNLAPAASDRPLAPARQRVAEEHVAASAAADIPQPLPIQVNAIISNAMKAAGLATFKDSVGSKPTDVPRSLQLQINAVITNALKAAGLMKTP